MKKVIASHIGSNPNAGQMMEEGHDGGRLLPARNVCEKIRAGGVGLGGILVDVGVGTIMEQGKATVSIDEKTYLVEPALTADVAIVHAKKADPYGNLVYDKSGRNLNPLVAMAGKLRLLKSTRSYRLASWTPKVL